MKKIVCAAIALAACHLTARSQVTPEDVIAAVDQMTPAQVDELYTKLAARYWEPIPEGFFSRFGARIDVAYSRFKDADADPLGLSSGDLDLEDVSGSEITLLWQVLNPQTRMGLRLGWQSRWDSQSTAEGYSRAELTSEYIALVLNYQWIREDRWLLWVEGGVGGGTAGLETVDTPAGKATTLRELDGSYAMADLRLGVSWRFNSVLSLHASAGYRFAEEVDLEEGGRDAALSVDPSGFNAQIGLGIAL